MSLADEEEAAWRRQHQDRNGNNLLSRPSDPAKVARHLAVAVGGVRPMPVNEKMVAIGFTKAELWELMCNFDASFDEGDPENDLANRVSAKLHKAYDSVRK